MSEHSLEITLEEKMNLYADTKLRYLELENKFKKETADLKDAIDSLEKEIKADVLKVGETVKTDYATAVYSKGRETWDSKQLSGYALLYPDILKAKRIGEPSITIKLKG